MGKTACRVESDLSGQDAESSEVLDCLSPGQAVLLHIYLTIFKTMYFVQTTISCGIRATACLFSFLPSWRHLWIWKTRVKTPAWKNFVLEAASQSNEAWCDATVSLSCCGASIARGRSIITRVPVPVCLLVNFQTSSARRCLSEQKQN